jgi:hypothetical protein
MANLFVLAAEFLLFTLLSQPFLILLSFLHKLKASLDVLLLVNAVGLCHCHKDGPVENTMELVLSLGLVLLAAGVPVLNEPLEVVVGDHVVLLVFHFPVDLALMLPLVLVEHVKLLLPAPLLGYLGLLPLLLKLKPQLIYSEDIVLVFGHQVSLLLREGFPQLEVPRLSLKVFPIKQLIVPVLVFEFLVFESLHDHELELLLVLALLEQSLLFGLQLLLKTVLVEQLLLRLGFPFLLDLFLVQLLLVVHDLNPLVR